MSKSIYQLIHYLLCLTLCVIVIPTSNAQSVKYINSHNGLLSNEIYTVVQDVKGYYWIATGNGVYRYDGANFKVFTTKDGLPNNNIFDLMPMPNGKIYFLTYSEQSGFFLKSKVHTIATPNSSLFIQTSNMIQGNNIFQITKDMNYYLFADTLMPALDYIQLLNEYIKLNPIEYRAGIIMTPDGFIKNSRYYLIKYNKLNKSFQKIKKPNLKYNNSNNKNNGKFLSWDNTMSVVENGYAEFYNFATNKYYNFPLDTFSLNNPYHFSYIDSTIQISSRNTLFLIDKNNLFLKEKINLDTTGTYFRAFQDRIGNLIYSSMSEGIKAIQKAPKNAKKLFENKLINNIQIENGTVYVSVEKTGIFSINENVQVESQLIKSNELEKTYDYRSSFRDNYGGFVGRKYFYQLFNNTFTPIYLKKYRKKNELNIIKDFYIRDIVHYKGKSYIINDNRSIIEIDTQKKIIYDKIEEKIKYFIPFNDSLLFMFNNKMSYIDSNAQLHTITTFKDYSYISFTQLGNSLLFGSNGHGIFLYQNNKIKSLNILPFESIYSFAKENDSTVYAATSNGLKVLHIDIKNPEKSKVINSYFIFDGLASNFVFDVAVTDSLLYVGTDQGLSIIPKRRSEEDLATPPFNIDIEYDSATYHSDSEIKLNVNLIQLFGREQTELYYSLKPLHNNKYYKIENSSLTFSGLSPGDYELVVTGKIPYRYQMTKSVKFTVDAYWYQTNTFRALAIIGGLLSAFVIGVMFFKSRFQRQMNKRLIEDKLHKLQLQALQSQMNPHFIFNVLNAIKYYMISNETSKSYKYLTDFSNLIRQYLEYSKTDLVTLHTEIELLNQYLSIEKIRFEERLDYKIFIDPAIRIESTYIPTMLLQTAVENAINHGIFHKQGHGTITISFKQIDANTISASIQDDGIGITRSKQINRDTPYKVHSTSIIQERISMLNESKKWKISTRIKEITDGKKVEGTRCTYHIERLG